MSSSAASAVEPPVERLADRPLDLDVQQHVILLRRFEDAVATLVQERSERGIGGRFRHHEAERSLRIATNMRGHIR